MKLVFAKQPADKKGGRKSQKQRQLALKWARHRIAALWMYKLREMLVAHMKQSPLFKVPKGSTYIIAANEVLREYFKGAEIGDIQRLVFEGKTYHELDCQGLVLFIQ